MRTILVTGGAGFIGSNFVQMVLQEHGDYRVVNLDKLTYAGNLENLEGFLDHPNHIFVKGDICNGELIGKLLKEHAIDAIVHFAAESHVDRSLEGPAVFIDTNVTGTLKLLEAARDYPLQKFVQVSTDEVYGSLGTEGKFTESSPIGPIPPTRPARRRRIIWCGRSGIPGECLITLPAVPTITGRISFRRRCCR